MQRNEPGVRDKEVFTFAPKMHQMYRASHFSSPLYSVSHKKGVASFPLRGITTSPLTLFFPHPYRFTHLGKSQASFAGQFFDAQHIPWRIFDSHHHTFFTSLMYNRGCIPTTSPPLPFHSASFMFLHRRCTIFFRTDELPLRGM